MNQQENKIQCPNCGHDINVNELLYQQLDAKLKRKYNNELVKAKQDYQEKEQSLQKLKLELNQKEAMIAENVDREVNLQLQKQKVRLAAQLKQQLEAEHEDTLKSMQLELAQKTQKVKDLNKVKTEIERLKREKEELRATLEFEAERKMSKQLVLEREKIRKAEQERATMKITEQDLIINQLKQQLALAQQKAEQGSMQLQGEAQELVIEEWLSAQFPLDTIEEIKKGVQGADCIQIINTRTEQNCGTIYYESKRTKNFQVAWIEKFKNDIRDKNANIGVLVTNVLPADMQRMGRKDGIWICTFNEFQGLCSVLRESLIELNRVVASQDNKGDKMSLLYSYLTSNEFKLQVEAIVEGFTQMQSDLESEKRAMHGIWKKREKQIQKVLLNTTHMYQSVKGIAGSAVQNVALLELPVDE